MINKVELVLDAKAIAGENPNWNQEEKSLYWLDMYKPSINIYNTKENRNEEIILEKRIGCMALRQKTSSNIIAGMIDGIYFIELGTKKLTLIGNPEKAFPNNRFNDGKCDPEGRFWAGTMSMEGDEGKQDLPAESSLFCVNQDLTIRKKIHKIKIANGLAWDINKNLMYFIDTPSMEVTVFDYDKKNGDIENRRTAIQFPKGVGVPDGMTIDEKGMLWIAHFGGSRISRWNPSSGKMLEEYLFPVSNITSCAFGGKNLNELYITTVRVGLSVNQLKQQPFAGGLFRLITRIQGVPTYKFTG